jgi:hypothetical protein
MKFCQIVRGMFNKQLSYLKFLNFFDFKIFLDYVTHTTQTESYRCSGTLPKLENHSFIQMYNEIKEKFEIKKFKNFK